MKLKNAQAYKKAKENGWINDYDWFIDGVKLRSEKRTIWTEEKMLNDASYYNSIKELRQDNPKLYDALCRHKCLNKLNFKRNLDVFKNKKDNVYAYFFTELNSVYVGRSIQPLIRDKQHRNSAKSSVYAFSKTYNVSIPDMVILKNNLTPEEGLEWEDKYVGMFKDRGWNLINKAKTGKQCGSFGGCKIKWTKRKCYKEAQKYETLKDFYTFSPSAYQAANTNGWLDEYTWLKRRKYTKSFNKAA